jgi:hypothetical protein
MTRRVIDELETIGDIVPRQEKSHVCENRRVPSVGVPRCRPPRRISYS